MQTELKYNLYASLNIIPEIDINGSKQWFKRCSKRSSTSQIMSKMVRKYRNYRKGGKNFQKFEKFL